MTLTLTDNFVKRLRTLQTQQNKPDLMLRIQVNGGGCQGFEYEFKEESTQADSDHIFEKEGVKVLVDDVSLPFLEGAEIDYVDDLIGAHFTIKNPNATSSCGCGTSFSV